MKLIQPEEIFLNGRDVSLQTGNILNSLIRLDEWIKKPRPNDMSPTTNSLHQ